MKVNEAVWLPLESEKPVIVHQGGTSSGKTYGILQWLFYCGYENKEIITIFTEDRPALKAGAYRDIKEILNTCDWMADHYSDHNKSELIYRGKNGTEIELKSYSDEIDARQGKRDRSFCNEANSVSYEVWEQVNLRTKKQSIIDFNPSARFWAHENLQAKDTTEWAVTTFRDNAFIDPRTVQKILSYQPTPENIKNGTANEYRWKVYGLGEVGRLEGLVFPDWKLSTKWPQEYKWRVFGMDFGYTNDPTTLIEVRYSGGALYAKEHIYQTGLTNPDICDRLKYIGHNPDDMIVADSAEPKSIAEIDSKGWRIKGALKGKDSVSAGIDTILRYNLYITADSKNLIEEFSSYTWKKDRNDKPMNKPIDTFNHGIDAIRYAVMDRTLNRTPKIQIA